VRPGDPPTLLDELAAVDARFPGWHAWHSDLGRCYAVHANCSSGVTLYAPTPALIVLAVAQYQHEVDLVA
jgi:hypothetical protein